MRMKWKAISHRLKQLKIQVQQTQNALAFSFIEVSRENITANVQQFGAVSIVIYGLQIR